MSRHVLLFPVNKIDFFDQASRSLPREPPGHTVRSDRHTMTNPPLEYCGVFRGSDFLSLRPTRAHGSKLVSSSMDDGTPVAVVAVQPPPPVSVLQSPMIQLSASSYGTLPTRIPRRARPSSAPVSLRAIHDVSSLTLRGSPSLFLDSSNEALSSPSLGFHQHEPCKTGIIPENPRLTDPAPSRSSGAGPTTMPPRRSHKAKHR